MLLERLLIVGPVTLRCQWDGNKLKMHVDKQEHPKFETTPTQNPIITIGRVESQTFRLSGQGISREHCVLTFENGKWMVHDSGSKNGTYLDGVWNRLYVGSHPLFDEPDADATSRSLPALPFDTQG